MFPFFLAHGPAFKSQYVSPPIESIDVYPLMCRLLGIEPHPNDGSFENIKGILAHEGEPFKYETSLTKKTFITLSKSAIGMLYDVGCCMVIVMQYLCQS